MTHNLEAHNESFNNAEIAKVLEKMESAVIGYEREQIIVAALILAIGTSDPYILHDEARFRSALSSVSQSVCWALMSYDEGVEPNKVN